MTAIASCALLAALPSAASAQTVNGRLVDLHTEVPIPLGLVMMFTEAGDSVTATVSDEVGRFSISAQTPGSFVLSASALGYGETPAGVFELGRDGVITVQYRLRPQPLPIDEIIVSLERPATLHHLVRNGFVRRLQRGLGVFVTPYDIERSPARSTEQLLSGFPSIRIGVAVALGGVADGIALQIPRPDIGEIIQIAAPTGGWCAPTVYVDGMRVHYDPDNAFTLSSMLDIGAVEAIEVYRRPAEIPVEYSQAVDGCGVLVAWSKSGLAAGQRPSGSGVRGVAAGESLPVVGRSGPPPEEGEHIRLELDPDAAETAAVETPWQGTYLTRRGESIVATDALTGRALALPVGAVRALQVERPRDPGFANVRGGLAGTAFALGMALQLDILCRHVCGVGAAKVWVPSALTGLALGLLVRSRGPGTHWVTTAVPDIRPDGGAADLTWRLPLRR